MEPKIAKLSKSILAAWKEQANQFITGGVWTMDPSMKGEALESGDYSVKDVDGKFGAFQSVRVQTDKNSFFSFTTRAEVNEDDGVTIARFVAKRDHDCSNGLKILKGQTKWFAVPPTFSN